MSWVILKKLFKSFVHLVKMKLVELNMNVSADTTLCLSKIKNMEILPRIYHWFKEQNRKSKSKSFFARCKLEYVDYDIPFEERNNFNKK